MAVLSCNTPAKAGGTTLVFLNFEAQRSGSSDDRCAFRVVRRGNGQTDKILPTNPQFTLPGNRDVRAWTFVDTDIPADGTYQYVAQIMKLAGGGTFYAMSIIGVHFRR